MGGGGGEVKSGTFKETFVAQLCQTCAAQETSNIYTP